MIAGMAKGLIGRRVILGGLLLFLAACQTVNPATGKAEFTPFMSAGKEARVGAREHPKIVAQFGGVYNDPQIGAYVASIGGRLVAHSELAGRSFTFTVLDSAEVNAFALPGGYVYVTRGLLVLANSEAELAGVLAHEIGHVTARHTARRYSRGVMTGIGSAILGAVLGSSEIADLARQTSKLYLASYSRKQEYEADLLGVRYLGRTGYDPFAEGDFLATLNRYSQLEARLSGRRRSGAKNFLASHPGTAKRVKKAIAAAGGSAVKPFDRPRNRDRYLAAIDGMVYGENPANGYIQGQTYIHPRLGFRFAVPAGYKLINGDDAVIARGPGETYYVFDTVTVAGSLSMLNYVAGSWGGKAGIRRVTGFRVNGYETASGVIATSKDGRAFSIFYTAIRFRDGAVYRFRLLTPTALVDREIVGMKDTVLSFRGLSDGERRRVPRRRIALISARPGDTVGRLAAAMPFADYRRERFEVLNALSPGQRLTGGQRLKTVIDR